MEELVVERVFEIPEDSQVSKKANIVVAGDFDTTADIVVDAQEEEDFKHYYSYMRNQDDLSIPDCKYWRRDYNTAIVEKHLPTPSKISVNSEHCTNNLIPRWL